MPKIVHISRKAFEQGLYAHYPVAIRIADRFDQLTEIVNPTQQSYAFAFLDVDECESDSISEADASLIVHTLMTAKANNEDVVVHCEAGISRSGAVAQFAIDHLGFQEEVAPNSEEGKHWRFPNSCVLAMLVQEKNKKKINVLEMSSFRQNEYNEYRELMFAVSMGLPVWPNSWSQEVAMLAYAIHKKDEAIHIANAERDKALEEADIAIRKKNAAYSAAERFKRKLEKLKNSGYSNNV